MSVPPPPPILPSSITKGKHSTETEKCHKYFKEPLKLEEEVDSLVEFILKDHSYTAHSTAIEFTASRETPTVITFVRQITPVIQNGPMCGLAALSMASQLLSNETSSSVEEEDNRHPENLLKYAQTHQLSKQGELFSVDYVQDIVKHHLQFDTKILCVDTLCAKELVNALLCDDVTVLVPYDADKNNSPCQANGHKAHWCILVGFAIISLKNDAVQSSGPGRLHWCKQNPRHPWHYSVQDKESFLSCCSTWIDDDHLFVFARHGKSVRMGLWSYNDLMASCQNLIEIDPKRASPEDYVIPEGGMAKGLKSKLILICSKSQH